MRFPGIALTLPLLFSCSLDPNGSIKGDIENQEVRPSLPDKISSLSVFAKYANTGPRLALIQPITADMEKQRTFVDRFSLGMLNMTLTNGQVRPTFCDTMTFQRNAFGAPIAPGADLTNEYRDAGILVSTTSRDYVPGLPIAFDSTNPTGEDLDLGTPNERFGGRGRGAGGATNNRALGNLLIKAENTIDADGDGRIDVPDDDANGGYIFFDFVDEKCVSRAELIDIEDAERPAIFALYDGQQQLMTTIEAGGLGDNSVEQVVIDVCGVQRLKVVLQASGALHDVTVCNEPEPTTQVSYDLDLNNIVAIEFDLSVDLINGAQTAHVGTSHNSIDPAQLITGGTLAPLPLVSNGLVTPGVYEQIHFEMRNLEAIAADGSRMALPGSVVQRIDHQFEIHQCGSTEVFADWAIDARIEGDMLGLGIGVSFANAVSSYDTNGCGP